MKAKCSGWTRYYRGEITRVNSDGTYDIKFEDGERKRGVTEEQIEGNAGGERRDSAAPPRPSASTWRRLEAAEKPEAEPPAVAGRGVDGTTNDEDDATRSSTASRPSADAAFMILLG